MLTYSKLQFWFDNWLPWRLRKKISALKAENDTLYNKMLLAEHELYKTKITLRECVKKMYIPIRGSLREPMFSSTEADSISPCSVMRFFLDRQIFSFSVYKYSYPRYNAELLFYMAEETAEQMVAAIKSYVKDKVFEFYKKEFKDE